jgi:hypothetical protein
MARGNTSASQYHLSTACRTSDLAAHLIYGARIVRRRGKQQATRRDKGVLDDEPVRVIEAGAPRIVAVAVLGLLAALLLPVPAAVAAPADACDRRTNNTYQKLLECVTLEGVREHQAQFQKIAESNDDPFYPGSRAAGTEGYAESVKYVPGLLRDAGYQVTLDEFEFQFVFPALLQQLTPINAEYETGTFTNSGDGDVTGPVIPVDINLVPPRASTSGCEAADFAGLDFSGPNDIALIQRGTCTFADKALNAQAAGAEAVIIFNQGNTPDREALIVGTLAPAEPTIPVVGASFADGVALAQPGSTARVRVVPSETRTDVNVIAELPGTNDDNVVMASAHLDSVPAGPGINDNGSGSAALLETALMMAKVKPENTVRFAWWGAEESGLIGSTTYVEGLSQAERDRIALYLNYDMVGSPNYIFMVYDADQSTFTAPVPVPPGSEAIEDLYESYYTSSTSPMTTPSSPGAVTTRRSSRPGSPPGACSPAPRSSRPRSRRPSGAAPPASSSTPATTRTATPSTTSTCTPSR